MKHEMNDQELRPDPLVGAALRWAEGEVPLDDVDWAAMRSNIRSRSSLPLARRRAIQVASPRWVRPLLPIAAAASIAVLLWTGGLDFGGSAPIDVAPVTVGANPAHGGAERRGRAPADRGGPALTVSNPPVFPVRRTRTSRSGNPSPDLLIGPAPRLP